MQKEMLKQTKQPNMDLQNQLQWEYHAHLAYMFSRHVRHDIANLYCSVHTLELAETLQAENDSDIPLPDELKLENLKPKVKHDLQQILNLSHDVVLLSQSANRMAYQPHQTMMASDLLHYALVEPANSMMDFQSTSWPHCLQTMQVQMLGDMLSAALSVFYFQWTIGMHVHAAVTDLIVIANKQALYLKIPCGNCIAVKNFAEHLKKINDGNVPEITIENNKAQTVELAFWLARHILLVHGGCVAVDEQSNIHLTIPILH